MYHYYSCLIKPIDLRYVSCTSTLISNHQQDNIMKISLAPLLSVKLSIIRIMIISYLLDFRNTVRILLIKLMDVLNKREIIRHKILSYRYPRN